MKKILLIAAALFVGAVSFAQETNLDAEGNVQYGPYETNKFLDNWFVGGGLGLATTSDGPWIIGKVLNKGGYQIGNFTNTTGFPFMGEIFVGKWFDPVYGARVALNGLSTTNPGEVALNFWEFRGDVLLNASNLLKGYSATRKFNWIPYASVGYYRNYKPTVGRSALAGVGSLQRYMFNETLGAYCDVRLQLADARAFDWGNGTGANAGFIYNATLGLTYNLGKSDWTRKSSTVAAYAAAVAAAEAAAAQAKAAADAAKAAAEAQQEKATQEVEQVKEELAVAQNQSNYDGLFDEPIIAYFQIGKSTLSSLEKEHVKYVAKNLIARGENVKFTLSGNADSKTGTAKRNMQLSKERADYVYKMMTEELGIDGSRFTVKYNGGNDIFDSPELNRAVIIEKD